MWQEVMCGSSGCWKGIVRVPARLPLPPTSLPTSPRSPQLHELGSQPPGSSPEYGIWGSEQESRTRRADSGPFLAPQSSSLNPYDIGCHEVTAAAGDGGNDVSFRHQNSSPKVGPSTSTAAVTPATAGAAGAADPHYIESQQVRCRAAPFHIPHMGNGGQPSPTGPASPRRGARAADAAAATMEAHKQGAPDQARAQFRKQRSADLAQPRLSTSGPEAKTGGVSDCAVSSAAELGSSVSPFTTQFSLSISPPRDYGINGGAAASAAGITNAALTPAAADCDRRRAPSFRRKSLPADSCRVAPGPIQPLGGANRLSMMGHHHHQHQQQQQQQQQQHPQQLLPQQQQQRRYLGSSSAHALLHSSSAPFGPFAAPLSTAAAATAGPTTAAAEAPGQDTRARKTPCLLSLDLRTDLREPSEALVSPASIASINGEPYSSLGWDVAANPLATSTFGLIAGTSFNGLPVAALPGSALASAAPAAAGGGRAISFGGVPVTSSGAPRVLNLAAASQRRTSSVCGAGVTSPGALGGVRWCDAAGVKPTGARPDAAAAALAAPVVSATTSGAIQVPGGVAQQMRGGSRGISGVSPCSPNCCASGGGAGGGGAGKVAFSRVLAFASSLRNAPATTHILMDTSRSVGAAAASICTTFTTTWTTCSLARQFTGAAAAAAGPTAPAAHAAGIATLLQQQHSVVPEISSPTARAVHIEEQGNGTVILLDAEDEVMAAPAGPEGPCGYENSRRSSSSGSSTSADAFLAEPSPQLASASRNRAAPGRPPSGPADASISMSLWGPVLPAADGSPSHSPGGYSPGGEGAGGGAGAEERSGPGCDTGSPQNLAVTLQPQLPAQLQPLPRQPAKKPSRMQQQVRMGSQEVLVQEDAPPSPGFHGSQGREVVLSPRQQQQQQQQQSTALPPQLCGEEGCWHEVWATRAVDPVTDEDVLVLSQHDVTAKVEAERHLALVMEAEHRLLEQLFPKHILQHVAEEWIEEAERAATGAGMHPSAQLAKSSLPLSRSSLQTSQGARWRPVIRDCNALATWHPQVTLLFADIKGFTPMCKQVTPREVMAMLNDLFSRFDSMLDKFGVFKVETIGDCYFVAGGLMHEDEDGMAAVRDCDTRKDPLHAQKVFMFAKAMLAAAREVRMPSTGDPVQIRIGISSGPVVSGVVGTRMPRFCLFGDTVNTTSRMESTGHPGAIHASESAYALLRSEAWESTGGIEVKGKGLMQTYLWRPPHEELAERGIVRQVPMSSEAAACALKLSACCRAQQPEATGAGIGC